MESVINISQINDFLFCPKSLYLHNIYNEFDTSNYHDTPQTVGKISHENIDKNTYTTSKHILQGIPVYSHRFNIKGKIDIYDSREKKLIERKYKVKNIYKGYIYQLYAQMYCLEDMGYKVKELLIHSLSDNKRFPIPMPTERDRLDFEELIKGINHFNNDQLEKHNCPNCSNNVYSLFDW
jgi:CRISPR-associated protein Cas4